MRRLFGNLFFLVIVGGAAYLYRGPIIAGWTQLYSQYFPCKQPIAYSLGSFDERFGISKDRFLEAIKKAEAIWEAPTGKDLFAYKTDGRLKMNLVFDYRQEGKLELGTPGLPGA